MASAAEGKAAVAGVAMYSEMGRVAGFTSGDEGAVVGAEEAGLANWWWWCWAGWFSSESEDALLLAEVVLCASPA